MSTDLPNLIQTAIQASLTQDWQTAVDTNLHILQLEPNNIPALNRLAKAYEKLNQPDQARKAYRKVLHQDKFNNIAINNLIRLKDQKKTSLASNHINTSFNFIEEPGRTKTIQLTNLAPNSVISTLETSQIVYLKPNKRRVTVHTQDNRSIGSLPDDLSLYLLRLIKLGNKYEAAIKTVKRSQVEVFVREITSAKRLRGLPSFPTKISTKDYYSLLPSDPIAEIPLDIPDPENPDPEGD